MPYLKQNIFLAGISQLVYPAFGYGNCMFLNRDGEYRESDCQTTRLGFICESQGKVKKTYTYLLSFSLHCIYLTYKI